MKSNSYQIGQKAEELASAYLVKHGFNVINNNYKTGYGEIDIIASKAEVLIAIEVKKRKNTSILPYTISKKQMLRIQNAILFFISKNPIYNSFDIRFDAILVNTFNEIDHIVNAWISDN